MGNTTWTAKNSRNNVFRKKETPNKVPSKIFSDLEGTRKVRLMFLTTNYIMNGKCYFLRSYNQRNKVCLVDLEYKLQEATYD